MPSDRTGGQRRRPAVSAIWFVLVLMVSGCHKWVPAELGPSREFLNGKTRIHRTDGSTTIVMGPRIEGDSILGRAETSSGSVAVARTDVQRIELQAVDRTRTAIIGSVLLVLYTMLANYQN